jgi:ferritin-like metal-binding protein YciE
MAGKVSNPRDLLLHLLGEVLYVERRLAGGVLRQLIDAVADERLREVLEAHLEQTRQHVERCETAFRRLAATPSANQSRAFESAVAEHDELAATIVAPNLADVFHAQAALRTEHLELALYTAVLAYGDAAGASEAVDPLRESAAEEQEARELLERELRRLAEGACAR